MPEHEVALLSAEATSSAAKSSGIQLNTAIHGRSAVRNDEEVHLHLHIIIIILYYHN